MTLGFSRKGFIGFCNVLVERPELQDDFPFHEGSPLVKRCGIIIIIISKYAKNVKDKKGGVKSGRWLSTDDYGARAIARYRYGVVNRESATRASRMNTPITAFFIFYQVVFP